MELRIFPTLLESPTKPYTTHSTYTKNKLFQGPQFWQVDREENPTPVKTPGNTIERFPNDCGKPNKKAIRKQRKPRTSWLPFPVNHEWMEFRGLLTRFHKPKRCKSYQSRHLLWKWDGVTKTKTKTNTNTTLGFTRQLDLLDKPTPIPCLKLVE